MTEQDFFARYAESLQAAEEDMQNSPSGSGPAPREKKRTGSGRTAADTPEEIIGWRSACKSAERFIRKALTCEDWQIEGMRQRFTVLSGGGPVHEAVHQAAAEYVRLIRAERIRLAAAEDAGAEQLGMDSDN